MTTNINNVTVLGTGILADARGAFDAGRSAGCTEGKNRAGRRVKLIE